MVGVVGCGLLLSELKERLVVVEGRVRGGVGGGG